MSKMFAVCVARVRRAVAAGSKPNWYSRIAQAVAAILVFGAFICTQPAAAQFIQQGSKLVPTDAVEPSAVGASVALSADGNTAIVGAPSDAEGGGNAWIFVRSNGSWTQQGESLLGGNNTGGQAWGNSVALSADGNTAIVGGPQADKFINGLPGAGMGVVYTRSNGTWGNGVFFYTIEQNPNTDMLAAAVALSADGKTAVMGAPGGNSGAGKVYVFIIGGNGNWTGSAILAGAGAQALGSSVALSTDGNTLLAGGPGDDSGAGAAWVFTQSNGIWGQTGTKLIANPVTTGQGAGTSVALSADGKTAIVGGPGGSTGAAFIFVLSNGAWTQQGSGLVGSGVTGAVSQGMSVSLSGDGNTAILGGMTPNTEDCNIGAGTGYGVSWVFKRNGTTWSQQGSVLVGNGGVNGNCVTPGVAVALSSDASTAILGERGDNSNHGAAWPFARHIGTHDFNGDGMSDVVWRSTGASPTTVAMWLMNGGAIQNSGTVGAVSTSYSIVGQRDFNGDGNADLLWRDGSGNLYMWLMNGATMSSSASLGNVSPTTWTVMGTADMNGDTKGDILWQDTAGDLAIWFMNGSTASSSASLGTVAPSSGWSIVGTTTASILWKNTLASPYIYALWQVNGSTVTSSTLGSVPSNWVVQGVGDFNGDGVPDVLWRDSTSGTVAIWFLNSSGQVGSSGTVGAVSTGTTWAINQTGDYDGNGMSDILWIDGSGNVAIWFMNGATIASTAALGNVGTSWQVQAQNAE